MSGKVYEAITAFVGRRPRCALYHTALEVDVSDGRFVIESTPIRDKDSTKLTGKRAASTASIYEASVKPLVDVFVEFDADYIDIQGDCAIEIFWTGNSLERAFCAGVTVKTFSSRFLTPKLEEKWKDTPSTGFKVGMAASRILVKKVGRPRTDFTEPVWAGKAVNYAAKAAQSVDAGEMLVTGTVWEQLQSNDYIAYTCGCGGPPSGRTLTS